MAKYFVITDDIIIYQNCALDLLYTNISNKTVHGIFRNRLNTAFVPNTYLLQRLDKKCGIISQVIIWISLLTSYDVVLIKS